MSFKRCVYWNKIFWKSPKNSMYFGNMSIIFCGSQSPRSKSFHESITTLTPNCKCKKEKPMSLKRKGKLTLTTIERDQNCSTWLQMFNVHGQTFFHLYITKVILEFTLDNIGTKSMRRIYYECRNFLQIRGVSYKCLRLSGMRN